MRLLRDERPKNDDQGDHHEPERRFSANTRDKNGWVHGYSFSVVHGPLVSHRLVPCCKTIHEIPPVAA
jgi:hypothetical protein